MKTHAASEARKHFFQLLDNSQRGEVVRVKHRDGRLFELTMIPEPVRFPDFHPEDVLPTVLEIASSWRETVQ
jgi:hypothetical protein